MSIPDGPAPRPFTQREGFRRLRVADQAAQQRGVLNTATTPVVIPGVQYSRGAGSTMPASTWTRIGGFSISGGTEVGISFSSADQEWTLSPGWWQVKLGLRFNTTSSGSDAIIAISPDHSVISTVYPMSEGSFRGVATGVFCSTSTDIIVTSGTSKVNMWASTPGTPTITDGMISFFKAG